MGRMLRLGISRIVNGNRVSQFATIAAKTSPISDSMVEYLMNSLGFSKDEALFASSKVNRTFKSTLNPNSVVDFLKITGFSQTQIKTVISKEPRILFANVDKTLKPKIRFLRADLGFSGSEIADMVSLYPRVCSTSLDNHIIPTFEALKSVLGDDNEILLAAITKKAWLIGPSAMKDLPGIIPLLQSYGVRACQIKRILLQDFKYMPRGTKVLERILIRVEKLGIPRDSPMFFHGLSALCRLNESTLELRMGLYKSYGFTDKDILTLFGRNPYTLTYSETKLRKSLDFCMKEAGYYPTEIARNGNVLTCSLEKRVLPRYKVWKGLKEKGLQNDIKKRINNLNDPFLGCLKRTDLEFIKKFVQPFKDQCPDLYSDYMKTTGSVLEVKAAK